MPHLLARLVASGARARRQRYARVVVRLTGAGIRISMGKAT